MVYIVFDLEATCDENNKNFPKETIEIGAIKVNDKFDVVDTFDRFVRPKLNPTLTDFCKKITSIEQKDIYAANLFPDVIKEFKEWIGVDDGNYILCSWGFYDKGQLLKDSRLHGVKDTDWISLKHQFADIIGTYPCGMSKALKMLNLALDGTHHRGIDDAKNISKIFIALKGKWDFSKAE